VSTPDFRGSGWPFPARPGPNGRLEYVAGDDNIEQSVLLVVRTFTNERVMRPDFGTSAADLLFESNTEQHLHALELAVADALQTWEPRIELDHVTASLRPESESWVDVTVEYRILQSNTKRNLVFPFYASLQET
jgi:phage baseplate assembly protein W